MLSIHKETGLPIAEGLTTALDLPHTLSFAILYRARLDSFNELPREKRPPRSMWDRPFELSEYLEHVWDTDEEGKPVNSNRKPYEFDLEEVE